VFARCTEVDPKREILLCWARFKAVKDRRLAAFKLIGIGWFVSACVVLGGRWFDGKMDSGPLWLIIGLLTGIFIAFYGVYRMLPEVTYRQNKGSG